MAFNGRAMLAIVVSMMLTVAGNIYVAGETPSQSAVTSSAVDQASPDPAANFYALCASNSEKLADRVTGRCDWNETLQEIYLAEWRFQAAEIAFAHLPAYLTRVEESSIDVLSQDNGETGVAVRIRVKSNNLSQLKYDAFSTVVFSFDTSKAGGDGRMKMPKVKASIYLGYVGELKRVVKNAVSQGGFMYLTTVMGEPSQTGGPDTHSFLEDVKIVASDKPATLVPLLQCFAVDAIANTVEVLAQLYSAYVSMRVLAFQANVITADQLWQSRRGWWITTGLALGIGEASGLLCYMFTNAA